MKHFLFSSAIAGVLATSALAQDITIFTAQKIITMEDSQPEATAVAVNLDAGRIVSVGTLDSLSDYVDDQKSNINRLSTDAKSVWRS